MLALSATLGCGSRTAPGLLEEDDSSERCPVSPSCVDQAAPGMVGWYRFEEATGPAIDSAGCDDHGEARRVIRCRPGVVGNAYEFGDASNLLVPGSASLIDFRELTVEMWVRWDSLGPGTELGHVGNLIHHGPSTETDFGLIITRNGPGRFVQPEDPVELWLHVGYSADAPYPAHCAGTSTFPNPSGETLPENRWIHVAVVVDEATQTVRYYLGGNLSGSREVYNGAVCASGAPFFIGNYEPTSLYHQFRGSLDEVKIWKVLRSDREICEDAGGAFISGSCSFG